MDEIKDLVLPFSNETLVLVHQGKGILNLNDFEARLHLESSSFGKAFRNKVNIHRGRMKKRKVLMMDL